MSRTQIQLRTICEGLANNTTSTYKNIDDIIDVARAELFDFQYDVPTPDYKRHIESTILRAHWFEEIAFETVGMFIHFLRLKMQTIMPQYSAIVRHNLNEVNPYNDIEIERKIIRDIVGTGVNVGSSEGTSKIDNSYDEHTETSTNDTNTQEEANERLHVMSDTPQGKVTNLFEDGYATNVTSDKDSYNRTAENQRNDNRDSTRVDKGETAATTQTNSRTDSTQKEDNKETTKGHSGKSPAELFTSYRRALVSVDQLIINETRDLFMSIY